MATSGNDDLSIVVGGDISPFQDAINQIPAIAQAASAAIAGSFATATDAANATTQALQGAAQGIDAVGTAAGNAAPSLTDVAQALQQSAQAATDMPSQMENLASNLGDVSRIALLVGGALDGITVAMVGVTAGALETAGQFERVHIALTTLIGSSTEASAEMNHLVEVANASGQAIDTTFKGVQNMLARGFDVSQANSAFEALTAAAGAMNIPMDQLIRSFDSLQTRGTAALQQMARAGIPVWQMLSEAAGVSIAEIRTLAQKGALDTEDVMNTLLASIKDKYGAIPAQIADSFQGLSTRVANQIELSLNAIGQALLPVAKAIAAALIPIIQQVQSIAEWFGKLPVPIQAVGIAFAGMVAAAGPLITALGVFAFASGQIIDRLPALAELTGITLPASFTRSTVAVTANTVALEANAVAAEQSAAAVSTAGVSMGAAASGASTLGASLLRLGPYALAAATAIGVMIHTDTLGKFNDLRATVDDNASAIQQWGEKAVSAATSVGKGFIDAGNGLVSFVTGIKQVEGASDTAGTSVARTADQTKALKDATSQASDAMAGFLNPIGLVNGVMTTLASSVSFATGKFKEMTPAVQSVLNGLQGAVGKGVDAMIAFNASLRNTAPSLDLIAQGVKKADQTQTDLVNTVKTLQGTLDALKKSSDGTVDSQAEIVRVTNQLTAAQQAAYPTIKGATAAFNEQQTAAQSLGAEWSKFIAITSKIPQNMAALRQQIVDGFNFDNEIKSLDTFIQKLTSLGADADTNLGQLRDSASAARTQILNMLLALDPSKMQAFNVNGVQMLKSGIDITGKSANDMAQAMAKAQGISVAAASAIVKAWEDAMKRSQTAIGGFNSALVNGVTVITPYVDKIGAVKAAAGSAQQALTSLQQAQQLMNSTWQASADNAGRVALSVAQITSSHVQAANALQVAKQAFDQINASYDRGEASAQELAVAVQNYKTAAQAAIDPTGQLGGSIQSLAAAAQKAGGALAEAASELGQADAKAKALASSADSAAKGVSNFASSLDGSTTSLTNYIGLLKAMGASLGDIANAAAAAGFPFQVGQNSFISVDERNKEIAASGGKNSITQLPTGGLVVTSGYTKDNTTDQFGRPLSGLGNSGTAPSGGSGGGGSVSGNVNIDTSQVTSALNDLATAASSAAQNLADIQTAAASAAAAMSQVGSSLSSATQGVQSSLSNLSSGISSSGSSLQQALANAGSSAQGALQSLTSALSSSASSVQQGGGQNAASTVTNALNDLSTAAGQASSSLRNLATSVGSGSSTTQATSSIDSAFQDLSRSADDLKSKVVDLNAAVSELQRDFDPLTQSIVAAGKGTDAYVNSADDARKAMGGLTDSAAECQKAFDGLTDSVSNAQKAIDAVTASAGNCIKALDALSNSASACQKSLDACTQAANDCAKSLNDLTQAAAGAAKSVGGMGSGASTGGGGGVSVGGGPPIYVPINMPVAPNGLFDPSVVTGGMSLNSGTNGVTVHINNPQFIGTPDRNTVKTLGDAIMTYATNQMRQQAGQKV